MTKYAKNNTITQIAVNNSAAFTQFWRQAHLAWKQTSKLSSQSSQPLWHMKTDLGHTKSPQNDSHMLERPEIQIK